MADTLSNIVLPPQVWIDIYAVDWNVRSADLNIVGAFLVQSGATLTLADVIDVPDPRINIT